MSGGFAGLVFLGLVSCVLHSEQVREPEEGTCSWGKSFVGLVRVLIQFKSQHTSDISSHPKREEPKFTWDVNKFFLTTFFGVS